MMGTKVTGKTLGLIGMGRIAQAMAHKSLWLRYANNLL